MCIDVKTPVFGKNKKNGGGRKLAPSDTLPHCDPFPEDTQFYRAMVPDGETLEFWTCASKGAMHTACSCTVTRTVELAHNEVAAIQPGEYTTESACNSNCGRGSLDKCWLCAQTWVHQGGGMLCCRSSACIAKIRCSIPSRLSSETTPIAVLWRRRSQTSSKK